MNRFDSEKEKKHKIPFIAISAPLGVGIGAAIGTTINQLPLGVAIGGALGASIGAIDRTINHKNK